MANTIQAIVTSTGREYLAKSFGGVSGGFSWSYGQYFKLGVLGYIDNGTFLEPVTPDPSLTDIQSSSTSGVFWYRKTFDPSDILFVAPSTIQFRCYLDLAEANGDPIEEPNTGSGIDGPKNSGYLGGEPPKFFEVGLFDLQDKMIGYGTFPMETKLDNKTLNHLVNVNF
jgi:hypothetical protein